MLRPKATRNEESERRCAPRTHRRAPGPLRLAISLAIAALAIAPFAAAQHGARPSAPAPHVSAPRMSAPRQAAPQPRPQMSPQARPQTPYQTHASQGNIVQHRPSPYQPAPNNFAMPNRPQTSGASGFAPSGQPYSPGGVGYQQGPRNQYATPPARPGHLGSWLQNHEGQSFASQENSLRQEPGFNRLPPQQQQRMINHLQRLESMPPQKRALALGRIENMERLSPERQQAVRNSAQELSNMDPTRRQQVRGAFRNLRDLPPSERQNMLNSPEYRSQYSDHERQVLGNLLSVEPYTPR